MSATEILWKEQARQDLLSLYLWIAERAGSETAMEYTSRIEQHANRLVGFPHRGSPRDDLGSGVRTISYRRRTAIAYHVIDGVIEVLGLNHAGQDWEQFSARSN